MNDDHAADGDEDDSCDLHEMTRIILLVPNNVFVVPNNVFYDSQ